MRTQSRQTKIIALALWGMAVIYILILHNAAYEHDFYKFFFVPPVALTGAVAVEQAWQSRRWRPVMMAVLVTSLTGGWLYTGYLHHIARDPRQPAILQSIQTIAQPEEKLVTGASTASLGMFYYLNRPLTLNVSPEQALERRKTETDPMLYIYCPVDKLPESLKSYTFTVDEYCAYIRLPTED